MTGLPAGATASFTPDTLVGLAGLSSDLAVTVPRSTPKGTYVLTITGTSNGASRSTTVQLVKQ